MKNFSILFLITSFLYSFVFTNHLLAQDLNIPASCNESIFKACICANQVPKDIKFRPRLRQCGGKAATILSGEYANSFSVVLRDFLNRDRFPESGFNSCTKEEADLGLAKCSAYKCQKTIRRNQRYICCYGDSGRSAILSKVTRMTIKIKDDPFSSNDPLLRVCLNDFTASKRLN